MFFDSKQSHPRLMMKDKSIRMMISGTVLSCEDWSSESHHKYSLAFQRAIKALFLALNRIRKTTGVKIPR